MPKSKAEQLDPKDRKTKPPKSLRKAKDGLQWFNVDRVGGWEPVLADETSVLTDKERKDGDTKITREDREAARELERELGRAATRAERQARKAERQAEKAAKP